MENFDIEHTYIRKILMVNINNINIFINIFEKLILKKSE